MRRGYLRGVLLSVLLLTLFIAPQAVSAQSDDGEGTGAESSDIPCADFTYWPRYPEVGETVRFSISPANLPTCRTHYVEGYIRSYIWYIGNDNIPVDGGVTTETSFDQPGEHTVGLEATNHLGESTYHEKTIVVGNVPPPPVFSYTPNNPEPGQGVVFDATDMPDPENEIEEYRWTFGDGTTATGVRLNHTYAEPGEYEVTLTVDNGDRTNSRTETVTVEEMSENSGGDDTAAGDGDGNSDDDAGANSGNGDTTGDGVETSGNGNPAQSGEGNSTGGGGNSIGESLDGFGVVVSIAAVVLTALVAKRIRK